MKSIRELAWNVSEEDYRADKALSYSNLSTFEREGWRNIEHLFDKKESSSLTFGSIVDTLITESVEEFKKRFVVCDFPPLTDSLITITKYLYNNTLSNSLSDIDDEIINQAALINNYYANPKYEKFRIKTIKEQCGEYYSLLALSKDKKVISTEDYNKSIACVNELRENEVTKHYFNINPFETNIEKVFQLKFKSEYEDIPVRCMFDLIIVLHDKKTIIPCDLKTSSHYEENFQESFKQWNYMIQAQLYSYILKKNIEKDEYFKNFTIGKWKNIVINKNTLAPMVWTFPYNMCELDMQDENGKVFRNWRKILKDCNYYLNRFNNKYSKEAIENNCNLNVECLQPLKK